MSNTSTSASASTPDSIPPQHLAFLEDRALYGDTQDGSYKGLKWQALRPSEAAGLLHWNGYVEIPRQLTDEEESELDNLSHGGITGGSLEMPGFDCAHARDYQPSNYLLRQRLQNLPGFKNYDLSHSDDVYRDFPYVLSVIERMIDYLSELPKIGLVPSP